MRNSRHKRALSISAAAVTFACSMLVIKVMDATPETQKAHEPVTGTHASSPTTTTTETSPTTPPPSVAPSREPAQPRESTSVNYSATDDHITVTIKAGLQLLRSEPELTRAAYTGLEAMDIAAKYATGIVEDTKNLPEETRPVGARAAFSAWSGTAHPGIAPIGSDVTITVVFKDEECKFYMMSDLGSDFTRFATEMVTTVEEAMDGRAACMPIPGAPPATS